MTIFHGSKLSSRLAEAGIFQNFSHFVVRTTGASEPACTIVRQPKSVSCIFFDLVHGSLSKPTTKIEWLFYPHRTILGRL